MNTTIRNLDETAYRRLKARAAIEGRTVGELINEAIRAYLTQHETFPKRGSLRDLEPQIYPKGSERLSEQIDAILYGARDP